MIGINDLIQNDCKSLEDLFSLIMCYYIQNEPGDRRKAVKLFEKLDGEQLEQWNEYLKSGSFPYSLAVEIEDFFSNVKA